MITNMPIHLRGVRVAPLDARVAGAAGLIGVSTFLGHLEAFFLGLAHSATV
jgi:hypothetical protein